MRCRMGWEHKVSISRVQPSLWYTVATSNLHKSQNRTDRQDTLTKPYPVRPDRTAIAVIVRPRSRRTVTRTASRTVRHGQARRMLVPEIIRLPRILLVRLLQKVGILVIPVDKMHRSDRGVELGRFLITGRNVHCIITGGLDGAPGVGGQIPDVGQACISAESSVALRRASGHSER